MGSSADRSMHLLTIRCSYLILTTTPSKNSTYVQKAQDAIFGNENGCIPFVLQPENHTKRQKCGVDTEDLCRDAEGRSKSMDLSLAIFLQFVFYELSRRDQEADTNESDDGLLKTQWNSVFELVSFQDDLQHFQNRRRDPESSGKTAWKRDLCIRLNRLRYSEATTEGGGLNTRSFSTHLDHETRSLQVCLPQAQTLFPRWAPERARCINPKRRRGNAVFLHPAGYRTTRLRLAGTEVVIRTRDFDFRIVQGKKRRKRTEGSL